MNIVQFYPGNLLILVDLLLLVKCDVTGCYGQHLHFLNGTLCKHQALSVKGELHFPVGKEQCIVGAENALIQSEV